MLERVNTTPYFPILQIFWRYCYDYNKILDISINSPDRIRETSSNQVYFSGTAYMNSDKEMLKSYHR
jgi:hypothetical protein